MVLALDTPPAAADVALVAEKPSLAGLGREGLRAALAPGRGAGQAAAHARQPAVQLAVRARRAELRRHDRRRQGPARRRSASAIRWRGPRSSTSRCRSTARANGCCGSPRRDVTASRPKIETVYIPEAGARHAVHIEPGRLHAELHVLPYGHAAPRAQPHRPGDRRPDPAGARPHRRLAGRGARRATGACCHRRIARSPTSCSWAWASRCTTSTTSRRRWKSPPTARDYPCRSGASRCRPPASFRRSPAGAPRPAPAGHFAACGAR